MPRKQSDKTKLRIANGALVTLRRAYETASEERNSFRVRATKAEQEVAEWKRRFDALLARDKEAADAPQA